MVCLIQSTNRLRPDLRTLLRNRTLSTQGCKENQNSVWTAWSAEGELLSKGGAYKLGPKGWTRVSQQEAKRAMVLEPSGCLLVSGSKSLLLQLFC